MIFGKKKAPKKVEVATDPMALSGGGEIHLPPLEIKQIGISKEESQGLSIAARQLPGYPVAIIILANAINGRADRILMDFNAQGAVVRYRIDGVWETLPPLDRPTADGGLVAYKKILGLNPNERRAKQEAKFATNFKDQDWVISFVSTGTQSGERVLFSIDTKKPTLKTLADLGMREAMVDSFRGMLNDNNGLVLISAPPTHGLPTFWRVSLENADKFVRDWISVEDVNDHDPEIINVTQNTFDKSKGESGHALLVKLLLKEPDVLILPSLLDDAVVQTVFDQVTTQDKHSVTRISGADTVDAIQQLLVRHRSQAKNIVKMLSGVVCQRLVRRLCDKCKQPYQPSPQLLQKLGIPAGRITKLYNPTIPPPPEQRVDANGKAIEIEICTKCNGRGYYGRMGIFELMKVDDTMRQGILKYISTPDNLRKFAKQQGNLSFQEEGIAACGLGHTSLQEIQKMLSSKSQ